MNVSRLSKLSCVVEEVESNAVDVHDPCDAQEVRAVEGTLFHCGCLQIVTNIGVCRPGDIRVNK
jgi:hypothetical protein